MDGDILAFDYGEKRIGVARASWGARLPEPLITLVNGPDIDQELLGLIEQCNANTLVVGLPRGAEGQLTKQSQLCQEFAEHLEEIAAKQVNLQDESHTSQKADDEMQESKKHHDRDQLAATYILGDYLEAHK